MKQILRDGSTKLIDVRTAAEYKSGHLHGALNIPLDEFPERYTEIPALGKNPVVVYCRSGNRSGQAVAYLQQKGIKNVFNGGAIDDLRYYRN